MKSMFLESETIGHGRFNQVFCALLCCRKEPVSKLEDGCIEEEEKQAVSTQFSQTQKSQHIELEHHLDRYSSVVPVFDFNSGTYDKN